MLREVIDIASLEDFVSGMARSARLRVCVYDSRGELIVASPSSNEFGQITGHVLGRLPANMPLVPVPAHDPPGHVAFVESRGVWYVVAPVYGDGGNAGYVAVGEFRERQPAPEQWAQSEGYDHPDYEALLAAWQALAPLDRSGHSQPVVSARWGARQLSEWCHREARLIAATDEVALVGDIAELLTGEQDLQTILDRIVSETARVMDCPFCSMRLYDPKTNELTIQAVHNLSPEYIGKGSVVRTAQSVADDALRGRMVYIEDVTSDPRVRYHDQARREGIVSMLTAGMIYRGNPVGLLRVYTKQRRRFRRVQRSLLRAVAYQAATAIVHAQLVAERLRAGETERQLALAGDMQERMIRIVPPHHDHVDTAVAFHPTYEVAGDFCDFLTLGDGRLAGVVGDVVGKGIPAALLMASARGALRATAALCSGPGELLTRLNDQICRETLPSEFITLLMIAITPDARQLTYANAGHEPLLILRDGEIESTTGGDLVLGVNADEAYHEHALPLQPGDRLLLYTDGATEARNFKGEEFGRRRLHDSFLSYGRLEPRLLLDNIVWDIRRFVGMAEQADDLTLVALRIHDAS